MIRTIFDLRESVRISQEPNPGSRAFVLIEVLVSMTILAIAGTVLMRTLMNCVDITGVVRDTTKAIFLTQEKLHWFEMQCWGKAATDLGYYEGSYDQPGASDFRWHAQVDLDQEHDAYVIKVWTTWGEEDRSRRRRSRWSRQEVDGFMLKTIVPTARYNEDLVNGLTPVMRERGTNRGRSRGRGRSQRR